MCRNKKQIFVQKRTYAQVNTRTHFQTKNDMNSKKREHFFKNTQKGNKPQNKQSKKTFSKQAKEQKG